MPEIIITSSPETTAGIYNIIGLISEQPDFFECLVKISKSDQNTPGLTRYAWAALFREADRPGPFVVYVNYWGPLSDQTKAQRAKETLVAYLPGSFCRDMGRSSAGVGEITLCQCEEAFQ